MYLTADETMVVNAAVHYVKRNFQYYRYARWFDSWEDDTMRDGALRSYIATTLRTGERINNDMYTALAKFHHAINPVDRMLVVSDIPTRHIGGSINRMMRVYHERYYEYSGVWLNTQNEVIMVALMTAPSIAAPMPVSAFTAFVQDVRIQMNLDTIGMCNCGIRASKSTCVVCGTAGK